MHTTLGLMAGVPSRLVLRDAQGALGPNQLMRRSMCNCGIQKSVLGLDCTVRFLRRPGCLTVNIGDGLTRWTDGILKSTYHRVRAPKGDDPKVRAIVAYSLATTHTSMQQIATS